MTKDLNFEVDDEKVSAQRGKFSRMRHLKQYKNLSDDEFDKAIAQKALGISISEEFEKRITAKMEEFAQDYDLSDLKSNDRDTLRALIQTLITLEDFEQQQFKLRQEGINDQSLYMIEKLQRAMSDLRSDSSKLQADLNITRKSRKSDQDVSVMAYIDGLKKKAKTFYESKMSYVFCPKCNMLLGTFWTQYPENDKNKIVLYCGRHLEDGQVCGEKVVVSTEELLKNRGTNKREIFPESML